MTFHEIFTSKHIDQLMLVCFPILICLFVLLYRFFCFIQRLNAIIYEEYEEKVL